MKSLADAVGLGRLGLGFGVVDVFDGQIELVFMVTDGATKLGTPVGQDAQQGNLLFFEPGQDPVVEQVCGRERIAVGMQLGESHFAVGVDKGLLVNPADSFDRADIIGVRTGLIRLWCKNRLRFRTIPRRKSETANHLPH